MSVQCFDGDGVQRTPWYKQHYAVSSMLNNSVVSTHTSTTLEDAYESVLKMLHDTENTYAEMEKTDQLFAAIQQRVQDFLDAGGGDMDFVTRTHGNYCIKFEVQKAMKNRW